jgi:hypothetical protein
MRTRVLATVAATFALLPAAASAADRYASPSGTSNLACGQADPCDIVTAVSDATNGDTVIIEPGTYSPSMTLDDNGFTLDIQGQAGSLPVINSSAGYGFELKGGSTLSNVEVIDNQSHGDAVSSVGPASTISHVIAETSGQDSVGCLVAGLMVDSLCWASGLDGNGAVAASLASSAQVSFDNDTLIASGSSGNAVAAEASNGTLTLSLNNTIARGMAADILAQAGAGHTVNVTASHSNFGNAMNDGGGGTVNVPTAGSTTNQTSKPVFANATGGNFHELSNSPTIGAGANLSDNGTADLDGDPREIQGKTDIGAYEFVPAPSCSPANVLAKYGKPVSIALHCTDFAGAPLTYAIATNPAHGTVTAPSATGSVVYTPARGFSGPDQFTFDATSTHGTSATATEAVDVGPPPPPPPLLSVVKLHKTTLQFTLNEAASVTLTFARRGHKKVTVKLKGKAGKNSYKIKKLKAGKYTITIAASNVDGRAKSKSIGLKIKR